MSNKDGLSMRIFELTNKKLPKPSIERICYKCGRKGYRTTMKRLHLFIQSKYLYYCRYGCLAKDKGIHAQNKKGKQQ